MAFFSWRQWLRRLSGTAHRSPFLAARLKRAPPSPPLELESLEPRLAPATHIWTGAAGDGKWATAGNWQSNFVPTGGLDADGKYADLVFGSAGALFFRSTHDDLAKTSIFNSITISDSNYSIDALPASKPGIA